VGTSFEIDAEVREVLTELVEMSGNGRNQRP